MSKRLVLSLSFLIVLVAVIAGCGEANIQKVDSAKAGATPGGSSTQASPSAKPEQQLKIGESVSVDNLIVTVNSIRNSKSQFMTPKEGNEIVLVDVVAENKSDKEVTISSMLQTKVSDDQGYQYNLTVVDDAKGSFDGNVAAGKKLRGEVAFEVPKNAASLEFMFSEPFKNGQAIWKLK